MLSCMSVHCPVSVTRAFYSGTAPCVLYQQKTATYVSSTPCVSIQSSTCQAYSSPNSSPSSSPLHPASLSVSSIMSHTSVATSSTASTAISSQPVVVPSTSNVSQPPSTTVTSSQLHVTLQTSVSHPAPLHCVHLIHQVVQPVHTPSIIRTCEVFPINFWTLLVFSAMHLMTL